MEWSDISSAVAKYAPMVATTLSSPFGAAITAGKIIADLMGVDATPESVLDAINNNPEKAQEKITVFERIKEQNRHEEVIKDIELKDRESARKNSATINASPIDNKIKMRLVNSEIAALFVSLAAIIAAMFYSGKVDEGLLTIFGIVIGYVIKSLGEKSGFYWGTSLGSQKKDDVISGRNR